MCFPLHRKNNDETTASLWTSGLQRYVIIPLQKSTPWTEMLCPYFYFTCMCSLQRDLKATFVLNVCICMCLSIYVAFLLSFILDSY